MVKCAFCNKKVGKKYYTIAKNYQPKRIICNHCKWLFDVHFKENERDNCLVLNKIYEYVKTYSSTDHKFYIKKVG